jgi:hypothetical protein
MLAATDLVLIDVPCFAHLLDVCAGDGFKSRPVASSVFAT